MRIVVAGDLHGDVHAGTDIIRIAEELGIQHVIQVGDFGYWPHFNDGIEFLDAVNGEARRAHVTLSWLDGNHENFDALESAIKHYPKDHNGRVRIRSNIKYCSRGAAWTWDNKRFMTVGGAVSVDRDSRVQREFQHGEHRMLWWPQEQLTDEELDFALAKAAKKPVDYLFTHDCPTNAPFRGRLKEDPDSQAHRQKMDKLGRGVKPKLWFHGHMHTRYDGYEFPTYESHTTVYGLECNPDAMHGYGTQAWWLVLDTESDKVVYSTDL